jgi:phospholipid-transporting ATPase
MKLVLLPAVRYLETMKLYVFYHVSCPQAAHIGCGISGREGRAAVLASDYSFAQFKYLARLLLVHGRSFYRRNTEVVFYSFYKNWVHNLTYIYFAFVTGKHAAYIYSWLCCSLTFH